MVLRTAAFVPILLAALTSSALASCDRSPTTPSPRLPELPPPPVITRVELIAPRSIAPGASRQLSVIAHRSDGTTHDITSSARFSSSRGDILAITPDGVGTGLRAGESFVSAYAVSFTNSHEIVVVPDGTFRVRGQVVDEDSPTVPIDGARVDVEAWAPVLTSQYGHFLFYGVAANARLRVSKSGYVTKELTLALSDHHTQNVGLAVAAPRLEVSGTYQLTIVAADQCRGQLPDSLRTRRYTATITQRGALIEGRLTGATFVADSNMFGGTVTPTTGVVLDFPFDPYYGEPSVIEVVSDETYLLVSGAGTIAASGGTLAGSIGGVVSTWRGDPYAWRSAVGCLGQHRVTFVR